MDTVWKKVFLPEVVWFQEGPGLRNWQWTEDGIKVINGRNILTDGSIDLTNTDKFISRDEFLSKYQHFSVNLGDIVVTSSGTLGKVGRIRLEHLPLVMNTSVIRFKPLNMDLLDKDYLFCFLRSNDFQEQITSFAIGSAQPNFGPSHLQLMTIPLPPLPIQRRIAGILSAYDDLIENNQRRIAILETMARSLYREWFVHYRYPGHEDVPLVDSPLGPIPQGWEVVLFEQLLKSMTGGDWGSEQPADNETEPVIVVRGTDFEDVAYGNDIRAPLRYIKSSSLVTRNLQPGDVILENSINAKSRSAGKTLLVDNYILQRLGQDAIAASFCKVFRPHNPLFAPLIHLHARYLREISRMEYYQNVAANGIANFQAQKFAREEHLILPIDESEQTRLIEPIVLLFKESSMLASQTQNLRRTRDLLLPRLLSGQIDVGEL